jgi:hypothetical protein
MPSDFVHARLGPLTFDSGLNWYSADREADGLGQLHLSLDDCVDAAAFLDRAANSLSVLFAEIERAKLAAAPELLHLSNTEWLPEGRKQNDTAAFIEKLNVKSVVLYPDSQLDIFFRASDLFAGHGVVATVGPEKAIGVDLCG